MSHSPDIAAQIAADIRHVMQPLVGKPHTPRQRAIARKKVEHVLKKYREAGLPIDNVIALRDVSNNSIHIRVIQKAVVDVHGVPQPIEFQGWSASVIDLLAYRRKRFPCKACLGDGEVAGSVTEIMRPVLCGRCEGTGIEPSKPGIVKA